MARCILASAAASSHEVAAPVLAAFTLGFGLLAAARAGRCAVRSPGLTGPSCRLQFNAIFDALNGQLTHEDQGGGRTLDGVNARVAARLPAVSASIWHNWRIGDQ
jgi:hypothetical protein